MFLMFQTMTGMKYALLDNKSNLLYCFVNQQKYLITFILYGLSIK